MEWALVVLILAVIGGFLYLLVKFAVRSALRKRPPPQ
jgi:hypothetical protein